MKNLLKIIVLLMILYPYSSPKADETQPSSLRAMGGNAVVYLHWSAPAEDVEGYWVYRALPGGDFQRINVDPVKKGFYQDTDLVNGQYYWYLITAIDKDGHESLPTRSVWTSPSPHAGPLAGY
jgi:hypothetical protein